MLNLLEESKWCLKCAFKYIQKCMCLTKNNTGGKFGATEGGGRWDKTASRKFPPVICETVREDKKTLEHNGIGVESKGIEGEDKTLSNY